MRSLNLAVMAVLIALAMLGCDSGKSTNSAPVSPSLRLIGHWASSAGDHLYFSNTDTEKTGNYTLVQPNGRTFFHKYQVTNENPGDQRMDIKLLFATGGDQDVIYRISSDGKKLYTSQMVTGLVIQSDLNRVDDKVTP